MGTILHDHKVYFVYQTKEAKDTMPEIPVTTCVIEDLGGEVVAAGTVKLHTGDQNNKLVARRYAFRKAVSKIDNKATRTDLWNSFRETFKQA